MTTTPDTLEKLRVALEEFAHEHDWNQFHNPKNLAIALSVEASELLEHFQWLTPTQAANLSPETQDAVALECADVLLFLIRLADKLNIDLATTATRKMELNAQKYPVEKARGLSTKYDRL
ncbi:MAG: nucleotide pyrophosphohydrolase [Betaproteobacteria bacterium]|nr:nucleotide pyrophosphohydrolase [Betaproteobacteria bacterium]